MPYKDLEKRRECARKWAQKNVPARRDAINNRRRERYSADPEKYIKYHSAWAKAHRESENERKRKYRKAKGITKRHREEIVVVTPRDHAEQMRLWRAANPDKARALRHNYKAAKRGNGGRYNGDDLKLLFEKQDGKCFYCGELIYSSFDKELHVDHKIPLSRGGKNDISNIALACSKCNLSKHTQTAEEFLKIMET